MLPLRFQTPRNAPDAKLNFQTRMLQSLLMLLYFKKQRDACASDLHGEDVVQRLQTFTWEKAVSDRISYPLQGVRTWYKCFSTHPR